MNISLPVGLGTSIGTLPHRDPVAAIQFVLANQPRLPALPLLPNWSPLERRVPQAASGIPGVTVLADGSLSIVKGDLEVGAGFVDPAFAGPAYRVLHHFLDALATVEGPAKFQIAGPVTLGLALRAAGLAGPVAFALAGEVVCSRIQALLALVQARCPGIRPVVFIDEPGLRSLGEAGFPLGSEKALDLVSAALAAVESGGGTNALRCGGQADWAMVLAAGPQILALPASAAVLDVAGTLGRFLDSGGWVAWGAVPTEGPLGDGVNLLWRHLSGLWCNLVQAGVDPIKLRTQALLTPVAGLGRHDEAQAAALLGLVDRLAERLYDQATGLRLSMGA